MPNTVIPLPPADTFVPSHKVAAWLIDIIDKGLNFLGLEHDRTVSEIVYVLAIAAVAIVTGLIVKNIILFILRKYVSLRHNPMGEELLRRRIFHKCSHIVPPLVFMGMLPFAFTSGSATLQWLMRLTGIYALICFGIGCTAVMTFIFDRFDERDNTRNLPIRGTLNIAVGILWIILVILGVSVLIDKSPGTLLAGLGAFAAALMLIFKDSILGFVAGIQMSQNDMIHVGDWIVVSGTPANGIVQDVSLSTVKIQNFDNTIITVPPYQLVQGSVQNWRGMTQSGTRRIMQDFTVSFDSIGPLKPELLDTVVKRFPDLQPYVDKMRGAQDESAGWLINGDVRLPSGSLETNLGLFRLYLCQYLLTNPHISSTSQVLVRQLQPTIYGAVLQIWCWTNTTVWNAYEAIQSAVIEHVLTIAPVFGLEIYYDGSETVDLQTPGKASN